MQIASQNVMDSSISASIKQKAVITFSPGVKLEEVERLVILETLKDNGFNRTHAAKVLGIGIRTLQRKLKMYGASHIGLKRVYLND